MGTVILSGIFNLLALFKTNRISFPKQLAYSFTLRSQIAVRALDYGSRDMAIP